MKRIGILSFHGAHNYGSMLQNYALQRAIKSLSNDYDPITINLRNKAQDDMYNIFKPLKNYQDKRRYLFKILMSPWRSAITVKQNLFEKFLKEKIRLSEQVCSSEDIKSLPLYDAYVVGSDQIWNFTAHDFDWAYFLDFISGNERLLRIAYAPSMGPSPSLELLSDGDKSRASELLFQFNFISVREKRTAQSIKELGRFEDEPKVCPDPTLLLDRESWESLLHHKTPLRKGKYIFLYNPYYLKEVYNQAKEMSKLTGIPIVISNLAPKTILPSRPFEKILEVGPIEFLNLISNAEYVIGRSFHLAVFSMIFNKKFIAVNGMEDSRLGGFLSQIGMTGCATNGDNLPKVIEKVDAINFHECNIKLEELRDKGFDFLRNSLKEL